MSLRSVEAMYDMTKEERAELHAAFWGQDYALKEVMERLGESLPVRRVNHMKAEVKELVSFNLTRVPRREGYAK